MPFEQVDIVACFAESIENEPLVIGHLVFTAEGESYIGAKYYLENGQTYRKWIPYTSFVIVDTLEELTQIHKVTSKIYCVDDELYRWDGSKLIELGTGASTVFIVVDSLEELTAMVKFETKLYCVGDSLYRWDGTKLIQLGTTIYEGGGSGNGTSTKVGQITSFHNNFERGDVQLLDKDGNPTGQTYHNVRILGMRAAQ